MKCEYCDSYLAAVPENGVCPNCGGTLQKQMHIQYPKPPVGIYKQVGRHVEITDSAVIFWEVGFFSNKTKEVCRIPFQEIVRVVYEPGGEYEEGMLCVRGLKNQYDLIPQTSWEKVSDNATITFNSRKNDWFLRAFDFLQQCAERNAEK